VKFSSGGLSASIVSQGGIGASFVSHDCYKDMNLFMHSHNLGCILGGVGKYILVGTIGKPFHCIVRIVKG
jgi:hypothetical protein